MIHTTNGETIAKYRDTLPCTWRAHVQGSYYVHASRCYRNARRRNSLAADRPAGPLCVGQRTGLPDDRRHHQRRRRQAGQRAIFASAGRIPCGQRLPPAAGHEQGEGAHRRLQGRPPRPTDPLAGHHERRDEPHHRPVPETVVRRGRNRQCHDRPARAKQLHRHGTPGNFQVFQSRGHSGVDLDAQYIWWHLHGTPVGEFPRQRRTHEGPAIDRRSSNLGEQRQPARKKTYAEAVNRRLDEQCYNLALVDHLGAPVGNPTVEPTSEVTLPERHRKPARLDDRPSVRTSVEGARPTRKM